MHTMIIYVLQYFAPRQRAPSDPMGGQNSETLGTLMDSTCKGQKIVSKVYASRWTIYVVAFQVVNVQCVCKIVRVM